ncbi:type VI secretion system Vgr family protein [Pseudoduganella sp. UC29_106]|uniref:type VI secretion system Vgr family protein n=1 Tax=Pseudoduganella sp. UC29_106 TaxID=3374553 RepID=UPI003756775B
MQLENALLTFLLQQRDLITEHRPLRLRLSHPTQILEDVLLPQRVYGTESICGGLEYRILCVALDAYLPLKELIALPVAIDFVTDRGSLRSVCGIVTEAAAGDSDGGLASYQLVLRDALAILEKRANTRVFRNKNEVEIVKLILDEWRQSNSVLGTCFDYETDELFDQHEYPKREFTMQYNESDAAFIRRLLKRRGIAWYFRADDESSPAHKLIMFNNAESIQANAAGVVRYHRDNATEERDSITAWCAVRTLQPGRVTQHSWDYMNPQGRDFMTTTAASGVDQGPSGNEMSASLDDYLVQAPHVGEDHEDLCQLGQLAMSRHDYESKCFHGEGSVRDLCAGEYFTLLGHPEIDMHAEAERDFVVTSLQVAALSNLPKGLAERVERLFAGSRWMTSQTDVMERATKGLIRTKIQLTAVRRGIGIVPAWDPSTELPNAPLQSAMVVGPEGEEVYCDYLGRVKVRFSGTREQDHAHAEGAGASNTDRDSAWLRVATSWAGNGPGAQNQCGFLGLPRIGSEVLVAFIDGNPDRPVIVGQLYNHEAPPPVFSVADALPGNRYLSGIRSREIAGARGNQLCFDDAPQQLRAQLSSDHGHSQLNLGFLTGPKVNGQGQERGEGAELYSENNVAVRGQFGVLISTAALASADSHQLERSRMTELLEGILKLGKELSERAAERADDKRCGDQFETAAANLRVMHEAASQLVAISAEGGLIAATHEGLSMGAAKDIDLISGSSITAVAGESAAIRTVRDICIYANEGSIKAAAASGKVSVQAQGGQLELLAQKVVDIISNSDWITLKAKKGVRINGGGTEIELSPEGIKGYTSGKHQMHAAVHEMHAGQSKHVEFPGDKKLHKVCVPCLLIAARAHSPFAPCKK